MLNIDKRLGTTDWHWNSDWNWRANFPCYWNTNFSGYQPGPGNWNLLTDLFLKQRQNICVVCSIVTAL